MSSKARALIGCCLTRNQLFKTQKVKTFEHVHPLAWNVDPFSGTPLWRDDTYCILIPNVKDYDYSSLTRCPELENLYFFHDRSGWGAADTRYLIGSWAIEDDVGGDNFIHCPETHEIAKLHDALKQILSPHGLWDESKFGLWIVHYNAI